MLNRCFLVSSIKIATISRFVIIFSLVDGGLRPLDG